MNGFFSTESTMLSDKISRTKAANSSLSRRHFLKSAAGATAIGLQSTKVLAQKTIELFESTKHNDPWLTLAAVQLHMFPASPSGPSANDFNALLYLFNVANEQPTDPDEKSFIKNGVKWLNDYSNSQLKQPFVALSHAEKETTLRTISQSVAGENWLSTIHSYLIEALLSPPSYGGNTNQMGWQWLQHQGGFPLPNKGQRYFEIPGSYRINVTNINNNVAKTSSQTSAKDTRKS